MSRLAFFILRKLLDDRYGAGRIGLLLVISIAIALWGVGNTVTAEMLFQSPASPPPASVSPPPPEPPAPGEPAPEPAQPVSEPPAGDVTSPQPLPQEPVAPESVAPPLPEQPDFPPRDEPSPSSARNFILDQVELIDTIVVSGAYIWLCCGVGLFLLVPVFLLIIYIRGRSKIQKQDDMFS